MIFDMIAAEAAQVSCDESLDDFWWAEAIDPRGETQAYGLGRTPAEARAGAWINVWCEESDLRCEECDLRAVPRSVPEGWIFEIYPPGEGPVFRRTTTDYDN